MDVKKTQEEGEEEEDNLEDNVRTNKDAAASTAGDGIQQHGRRDDDLDSSGITSSFDRLRPRSLECAGAKRRRSDGSEEEGSSRELKKNRREVQKEYKKLLSLVPALGERTEVNKVRSNNKLRSDDADPRP